MARLGQHFLTDPHYLQRVVQTAQVQRGDRILEIGPGTGLLTEPLLSRGARVVAIELDRGLAMQLKGRFDDLPGEFHLIQGDAAQIDWPRFDKLVSNLPYQISSPVLFRLLGTDYAQAVLTVQREFAQRLVATPGTGEYGRLTVKARLRARAEKHFDIPPGAFSPPPRVDSACVSLTPIEPPHVEDWALLDHVVDHAFNHRRKMLRSTFKGEPDVVAVLEAMDVETRRPERLAPDDWVALANQLARVREAA